jgi:hypothetical protein
VLLGYGITSTDVESAVTAMTVPGDVDEVDIVVLVVGSVDDRVASVAGLATPLDAASRFTFDRQRVPVCFRTAGSSNPVAVLAVGSIALPPHAQTSTLAAAIETSHRHRQAAALDRAATRE